MASIATIPTHVGSLRQNCDATLLRTWTTTFEILIDSNHGRRGGYVFQINPLGTQVDGLIVEEQGSGFGPFGVDFDPGWDGVWTSEARITSDGWTRPSKPLSPRSISRDQRMFSEV